MDWQQVSFAQSNGMDSVLRPRTRGGWIAIGTNQLGGWNLNQKLIEVLRVLRAPCSDIIPLLYLQPDDPISETRSFSSSLNPLRFDFGQLIKYA